MLIRKADDSDSTDVLNWRNDPQSIEMFFDKAEVKLRDHQSWYSNSLKSVTREMFIGEYENRKIGVCRFDLCPVENVAEVSINLNPAERGKKLSQSLLSGAIDNYLKIAKVDIVARIKKCNKTSIALFKRANFITRGRTDTELSLILPTRNLRFEKVQLTDYHSGILHELLSMRSHNISHTDLPSIEEHRSFIQSNPYSQWYIVFAERPVGTFYIQPDNSIGLNIVVAKNEWIYEIIKFIRTNFQPAEPIPSKIPPYFYINTACGNEEMIQALRDLNAEPIQLSFKI